MQQNEVTAEMEAEPRGGKRYFAVMVDSWDALNRHIKIQEHPNGDLRKQGEVELIEAALRESDERVSSLSADVKRLIAHNKILMEHIEMIRRGQK